VNRELEKMRRLLNIAEREGWILRNPMRSGDPLISMADERKRERIVTREEELRLLGACENRYRKHLRPILICALDTGMRRGEIFGLKWSDVDFEERVLTIRAFNTKTMQERQVSLTTRLMIELERKLGRVAEGQRLSRVRLHRQCEEELDIRAHEGRLTRRSFP
jgi:integrase